MKIVSLLPSATEIVCRLGLQDDLVAVTHECDFPPGVSNLPHITASRISHETMTSKEIDHAVRSQLDGHGSIYDLDTKLLEELKPDLILTQELCDVCAVSYKIVNSAAKIYAADATVISLEPNDIDGVLENILTVGELTGKRAVAENIISRSKERVDHVRTGAFVAEKRPNIFMLEWLEPPFAPGHWVPEQVFIAGGECILGIPGKPSVTTSFEAIHQHRPDVMVLIPCGYYIADTLRQLENTVFPSNWREIPAIRDGEVWAVDATSFSRPGPRIIDGVEILAKIFHSKIFGKPSELEAVRIDRDLIRFS